MAFIGQNYIMQSDGTGANWQAEPRMLIPLQNYSILQEQCNQLTAELASKTVELQQIKQDLANAIETIKTLQQLFNSPTHNKAAIPLFKPAQQIGLFIP